MLDSVAIVGHQGWPARYPGNTLSGLIAAAEIADSVEVDVRRSADGKLVLSHDPTLNGHVVAETRWSKMMTLDIGGGHHPILLDEALGALPDIPVQIEVKNVPFEPGFEADHRLALEVAERARPLDTVTSFNTETVAAVKRTFPGVRTGVVIPAPVSLVEIVNLCLDAGHDALVPQESMIVSRVSADLEVFPFTVNDPDRAIELVEMGVTGIITDDPELLSNLRG